MTCAYGTAMQVPLFSCASASEAAGRSSQRPASRRQRPEDRIELGHCLRIAADHQAVATLEAPDAAACADIGVVDLQVGEFARAANVVDIVGVAAVDHDVARIEVRVKH